MYYNNFKNGISPVVATALLLVVSVISVVGFQGWFTNFASSVFVDVESDSSSTKNSLGVEDLIGEVLYIKSGNDLEIKQVIVGGNNCSNVTGNYSGLSKLDVKSCIGNVSGAVEILVVTDEGIYNEFLYVDGSNLNLSSQINQILSSVSYSTDFGIFLGGSTNDIVQNVEVDSNGNIFVSGYIEENGGFDDLVLSDSRGVETAGGSESLLIKFDSSGNYLWNYWIGGVGDDEIFVSSIDSNDNILLSGTVESEVTDDSLGVIRGNFSGVEENLFIKMDNDGNTIFAQYIGSGDATEFGISMFDSSDNIVVAMLVKGNVDDFTESINGSYTPSSTDILVLKLNSTGGFLWGQYFGNAGEEQLGRLTFDNLDNIYITGVTSQVNIEEFGNLDGTFNGPNEGFLIKFDESGNYVWGQLISSATQLNAIKVDNFNNIYLYGNTYQYDSSSYQSFLSGSFLGRLNFNTFFLKLDSDRNFVLGSWIGNPDSFEVAGDLEIDSNYNIYISSIVLNFNVSNGGMFIAGNNNLNVSGSPVGSSPGESLILKFNSTGEFSWGQWVSGTDSTIAGIYQFKVLNDKLYLAGIASSSAGFFSGFSGNYSGGEEGFFTVMSAD